MNEVIEAFSTREISIIVWSILFFLILIFISRKEFLNILKALFHYKIILPFICFAFYCSFIILILYKINFWKLNLLKDTLIWFFSSGVIIFFNTNKIYNTNYFKKILNDNLKIIIFLEFVLNFYTFSIVVELILIPVITCIMIIYEYTKVLMLKNDKYRKINKFLKVILSMFGIIFLSITFGRFINNYTSLFTTDNIKSLYLPIILMIASFPFYYFLALIMIYENFFIQINFMFKNQDLKKELKKQILINANIRINRLVKIKSSLSKDKIYSENISKYIKSIK